jgi:Domain of unknown function (DUF1989)
LPYLRPLATITHDTLAWYGWDEDGAGIHDVIGTRCDPYTNRLLAGGDSAGCAQMDSHLGNFAPIFSGMASNAHTINPLHDCPTCKATGRVESRPPFRERVCPECSGTGHVTLQRREQLLKTVKVRT